METVLKTAGEGVSEAVGTGVEGVAGGYIGFMLSPWGLLVVAAIFLLIKWIR